MMPNTDMEQDTENTEGISDRGNDLPLIQLTKKKASKHDTPLEKEMRRFNKLVKELAEQERENNLQKAEDEQYQQLFFKKVHPMLVELAHVQLAFIEKLEEVFNNGKFSKALERSYVALAIPILQDAAHYLDAAKEKMENYVNWLETLSPKQDHKPIVIQDDDETLPTDEDDFNEPGFNSYPKNNQPPSEEVQKKSISELYKELAKLIHPDLEQDESIRHRKEQLMKELTEAKEKEDVHAMLLIQQKANIINKTSGSEKSWSLQLLKMYNSSMKKKLDALKRELQQKIFRGFGSAASFYAHGRKKIPVEARIKNDISSIKELQQNLQANTRMISTASHLKELLQQV
jgi:hypothetical protein